MKWRRYHRYVNGYWLGIYELPLQKAIARELKRGEVFYDIGANAGFFTVLAAKLVGSEGRVFAFEPLPENAQCVEEQIEINALTQCCVIAKAVTRRSGRIPFVRHENSSMAHVEVEVGVRNQRMSVGAVTLDDFIAEGNPLPHLVKIDVEGHETEVLAGASRLLNSASPPKFLIELHGAEVAAHINALLRAHGYRICDLHGVALTNEVCAERHILAFPKRF
jgi:FkbM family methyltransferase